MVNWSAKILHESRNEANKNKPLGNDAVIANDEAIASSVVNNDTQVRFLTIYFEQQIVLVFACMQIKWHAKSNQ